MADMQGQGGRGPGAPVGDLTILIVDDSRHTRSLIRGALQAYHLRRTLEAADAVEGLQLMRGQKIDVVLVDQEMPLITGVEFCLMVRRGGGGDFNVETPIIMITGHNDLPTVMEARNAGINEFLAKPVAADTLYGRIRSVILNPKPFVRSPGYVGPDRRTGAGGLPAGQDRRERPPSKG